MGNGRVQAEVIRIFREELQIEVPGSDADLMEGGHLDSLGFVDLVLHLERSFGIAVALDEVDFQHFRSVETITAFVNEAVGRASP